ncbi:MAG: hypothetical protein Kow00108_17450 [Calditrichia bacterium]
MIDIRSFLNDKHKQILFFTFLLSMFLWFTVKLDKRYETEISIPLRIVNLPENQQLKYNIPEKIKISVMGKGIDLFRLGIYDAYIKIDSQELPDSLVVQDITSPYVQLEIPAAMDLVPKDLVSPKRIVLIKEKKVEKLLPVQPDLNIETAAGYIVATVSSEPDTVLLSGAASVINRFQSVKTVAKNYKNVKSSFEEILPLTGGENFAISIEPEEVKVMVDVQRLGELILNKVEIKVEHLSDRYKAIPLPSEARLTVMGGTEILANVNKSDFTIYVDFDEYSPGSKLKAKLKTNVPIVSYKIEPEVFEFIVIRKGE